MKRIEIPPSCGLLRTRTGAWIVSGPRRRYRTRKLAIAAIKKDARKGATITLPPASCFQEGYSIEIRNQGHGTCSVETSPSELLTLPANRPVEMVWTGEEWAIR